MLIYVCACDEVTIHAECDAINNAEDGRIKKGNSNGIELKERTENAVEATQYA